MKLKIATLVVTALAGAGASVALADHGHDGDKGKSSAKCQKIEVHGTVAASSFAVTVAKANKRAGFAAGSTQTFAVPAGARIELKACQTGTGTPAAWTISQAEIMVKAPKATTTTATTTTSTTTTTTP
jgi:hypothetical protein